MPSYLRIDTPTFEFLESSATGDCYIKDKQNKKYFFKKAYYASQKPSLASLAEIVKLPHALDVVYVFLTIASIALFFYLLAHSAQIFSTGVSLSVWQYIFMLLFLLFNVVVHELCHYATLRLYGRNIGKIGFKLNFIFPAMYVNTSDSYMLPRIRRFFVYYSGIMSNLFLSSIVVFFFPSYLYLICPVMWGIFANLLPVSFVRTDGYHILFNTILNIVEYKGTKYKVFRILQAAFVVVISLLIAKSILQFFGIM